MTVLLERPGCSVMQGETSALLAGMAPLLPRASVQLQRHAAHQQEPLGPGSVPKPYIRDPGSGAPSAQLPCRRRRLRRAPGDASATAGQPRPFAAPASACLAAAAAAAAADAALAAGDGAAPSGAPW